MGVPYKLDKKIIEFIIIKKQTEPKIGCRNFVAILKDKFGVEISKSTVNSIIKESGLSRRIGRPRIAQTKIEAKRVEKKPPEPEETLKLLLKPSPVLPPEKEKEIPPKKQEIPEEALPKIEQEPIILPERIKPPKKPEFSSEAKVEKPIEALPPKPESTKPTAESEIPEAEKPEESPKKEPLEEVKPQKPLPEARIAESERMREIKKEATVQAIDRFIQPIPIAEDEIFDSMGTFFLRAAELEISRTSILGNLAREFISPIDISDSEIKGNILLYLPAFGIPDIEALGSYDSQGLWAFSNSRQTQGYSQIEAFFKQLKVKEELCSRLYDECDKNFNEAAYFKFMLSDGTTFFIDPRLKSIWQDTNIPDNFTLSLNKAKDFIEEKFIQIFTKESRPILLFNVPSFRSFSPLVSEFVRAFEDVPAKRIIEIDVFASGNRELEDYRHIVPAKRMFVFGFWPWQSQTNEFLKGGGYVKEFYFPELARQIYYLEGAVEFPENITLNLIFLKNSVFSGPRMGLLTNIPSQAMSAEEVIKLYLDRWPNFEDTYQDLMASSERLTYRGFVYPVFDEESQPKKEKLYILPASRKDLPNSLKTLLTNLSTASQRHFFPYGYRFADFSTMRERFYSLAGKLKRKDKNLYVSLLPHKDYRYSNDLFYAVRRINESEIRDVFGHKLWFKVL